MKSRKYLGNNIFVNNKPRTLKIIRLEINVLMSVIKINKTFPLGLILNATHP